MSNNYTNARTRVSQQDLVQSITLPPPVCLIPTVHPGAISSQRPHGAQKNVIRQTRPIPSLAPRPGSVLQQLFYGIWTTHTPPPRSPRSKHMTGS